MEPRPAPHPGRGRGQAHDVLNRPGRFGDFDGTLRIDEERRSRSRVEVRIGVASIDTSVAARDEHLRSAYFFEVERYPRSIFASTEVTGRFERPGDRLQVRGELTFRGATRSVSLDVVYEGRGIDPEGVERVTFMATKQVNRRDFGLTWNEALEAGGVLVGDEVRITLRVQAVPADGGEERS